jgi:hypothetical protein
VVAKAERAYGWPDNRVPVWIVSHFHYDLMWWNTQGWSPSPGWLRRGGQQVRAERQLAGDGPLLLGEGAAAVAGRVG